MTLAQLEAIVNAHAVWINSVISQSKQINELTLDGTLDADSVVSTQDASTGDAKKTTIPVVRGALGDYNATTNTPSLVDGTGAEGDTYNVSVGGTRDFGDGDIIFIAKESVRYINGKWVKKDSILQEGSFPTIKIASLNFELIKNPVNTVNLFTLEVNDVIRGWSSNDDYIFAIFLGGDSTLFTDDTVYDIIGGGSK